MDDMQHIYISALVPTCDSSLLHNPKYIMTMSTTSSHPPKRKNISYALPSSTLTLDIHLSEQKPINPSCVSACLSAALEEARKNTQSSIIDQPFRYRAAPPAYSLFGIVGAIFVNDLTWGDVVAVLQALQGFCAEHESYCDLLIFLEDERRGALGSAYVKASEETEAVTDGTA